MEVWGCLFCGVRCYVLCDLFVYFCVLVDCWSCLDRLVLVVFCMYFWSLTCHWCVC